MEPVPKPSDSPNTSRRWFSLPLSLARSPSGSKLQVDWVVLGAQLVGVALLLWLTAASVGFLWIREGKEFPGVKFVDVAFPGRWDRMRVAWGNHFIDLARTEMKQQKWAEAIQHLRYGVARAPANAEGRLILAQIFTAMSKPDLAEQLLISGVDHSSENIEFLKTLFAVLLQAQSDDEILKIATKLLPEKSAGGTREQIIALAAATARFYRGDYDMAEDVMEKFQLRGTKDGRMLQIWIEWERGYRDIALLRLAGYIREYPRDDEFYREMIRYRRQLGQFEEVQQYALLRQMANPQNPLSHIDLMFAYEHGKNSSRLAREIDEYMSQFSSNQNALIALADFAANTGNTGLARRVNDQCTRLGVGVDVTSLMVIESHVVAGEHAKAIALVEEYSRTHPEWFKSRSAVFNGLRAIAHFGLRQRDLGELYLKDFLGQRNLRAENLVAVSNRLTSLGERGAARQVLENAVVADSRNQAALAKLIELDLDSGRTADLAGNLRRLLKMRKPSHDLLKRAKSELGSDRYLFSTGREDLLLELQQALSGKSANVQT